MSAPDIASVLLENVVRASQNVRGSVGLEPGPLVLGGILYTTGSVGGGGISIAEPVLGE